MIAPVMTELQPETFTPTRQSKYLMPKADPHYRYFAEQRLSRIDRIGYRRRVRRTVRQKNPVRSHRQNLFRPSLRRYHRYPHSMLTHPAQNVVLDPEIVGDNIKFHLRHRLVPAKTE